MKLNSKTKKLTKKRTHKQTKQENSILFKLTIIFNLLSKFTFVVQKQNK